MEENETANECIVREIKEETGMNLTISEEPFLCIETYDSDYFGTGKKVLNSIYYYRFFTDELPNFEETQYDELELATEFHLFYVSFDRLESFLQDRLSEGKMDPNIAREMIHVVNEYHVLFHE